jgi:uncharacterized protein
MRRLDETSLGIGLRPELVDALCTGPRPAQIDFLELAPENWMDLGGRKRDQLDRIADRYPLVAHGLSLSIADTEPLNLDFIADLRRFLDDYAIDAHSDHLCLARDATGYLYDLLPTPRRAANIDYLARRIGQVQDITGRRLILENISYYHRYDAQMAEGEFMAEVARRSGCGLLLDINNAYINGRNHDEDPLAFVRSLPSDAIAYYHIAGHLVCDDGLILDTHGMAVADEVVRLGQAVWALHGPRPLLLERDNFVPALDVLIDEAATIQRAMIVGACHDAVA